jgi:hypothetical protein
MPDNEDPVSERPIPSINDLQTNPIKPDLKPIQSAMKVETVDEARLKEYRDEIEAFRLRIISMPSSDEKAALKKEIALRSLHQDLTDLLGGKRPLGQLTKNAMWIAIGGGATILAEILRGCL